VATSEQVAVIKGFNNFFKEFEFEGIESGRFYNTLIWKARKKGLNGVFKYVQAYFKLINNPYVTEVTTKMQSREFDHLVAEAKQLLPAKVINKRLEIYFGNPGVGKTMKVMQDNPDAEVVVCNSNFEPNDLLEVFDVETAKEELKSMGVELEKYDNMKLSRNSKLEEGLYSLLILMGGKPKYQKTALYKAMVEGKTVILDEIGKLTKQCQDFMVGFTDNKDYFEFKGEKIKIKEGFKIIGTMNLEINGNIYDLQSPLVDRAADLVEVHLNMNTLASISLD
jgi:hypothetical protein